MPYANETHHMHIPRALDRRVKLTPEDEEEIRRLHESRVPVREIARMFAHKCSRQLIQFVLFPERRAHAQALFNERRKDGRYKPTRESWAETMREHRRYRKTIEKELFHV